jgi:hypothetical protein
VALDQQRNWTIAMAENFEKVMSDSNKKLNELSISNGPSKPKEETQQTVEWKNDPIHLPDEIIALIISYINPRHDKATLVSCCRLSWQWYRAAVPLLYSHVFLKGQEFEPFVRAICPSINLHVRPSPLASLVHVLDMSNLVHQGSRSTTARILGRVKPSLRTFVAPQASFHISCLPALSKCKNLRVLDLSLVSECPPLADLFRTVSHLPNLEDFRLPRSAGFGRHDFNLSTIAWPPHLQALQLSGGIDSHFLEGAVALPSSIKALSIVHCPHARTATILKFLRNAVQPLPLLRTITLANLQRLRETSLDPLLGILPRIETVSVSFDYISAGLFEFTDWIYREQSLEALSLQQLSNHDSTGDSDSDSNFLSARTLTPLNGHYSRIDRNGNPLPEKAALLTLILTNSGNPGAPDRLNPVDIMLAMDEGSFPNLSTLHVANSLGWQSGVEENSELAREVASLDEVLRNAAALGTGDGGDGEESGRKGREREGNEEGSRSAKGVGRAGVFFFHG